MDTLIQLFAPWQDLVSSSDVIGGTVMGVHILALMIGGGIGLAADRSTLRVAPGDTAGRRVRLTDVREVHTIVLVGVIALFASGVLLAAAEIEEFVESPVFWVKLALAGLLVVNGIALTRTTNRLSASDEELPVGDADWALLRRYARFSAFLWIATAVVGIVLVNAS
jgi:hypothetical protein